MPVTGLQKILTVLGCEHGMVVVVSEDSREVGDGVREKENPCALRYFREKDKKVLDSAVVTAFHFDIKWNSDLRKLEAREMLRL